MKLSFQDWQNLVEDIISSSVGSCHPRSWSEDHISYVWLQRLTSSSHKMEIDVAPLRYRVAWDAYKADGPLEEDHGDIAILVRLDLASGSSFEGVAFLEAKRVYTTGYNAIKWSQLEYQLSKTPFHRLLLYDSQHISDSAHNLLQQAYCRQCFPHPFSDVRAVVLPTPHALSQHTRSRTLHATSQPLSYQITCRYLNGFDLDFNKVLVEAVKQGVADGVKYLLLAHVVQGPEGQPSTEMLEVNREAFVRLEASEPDDPDFLQ